MKFLGLVFSFWEEADLAPSRAIGAPLGRGKFKEPAKRRRLGVWCRHGKVKRKFRVTEGSLPPRHATLRNHPSQHRHGNSFEGLWNRESGSAGHELGRNLSSEDKSALVSS
jgi:hypothetical protein